MPRKNDRSREIDLRLNSIVAGGDPPTGVVTPSVAPAIPNQPPPTGLAVASNTILFSAVTPMALVGLTWNAPTGAPPAFYIVEYATNSGFTTNLQRVHAYQASAGIELPANTLYYFRVQGVTNFVASAYSDTVSVTTAADSTAAGQPTSIASDWTGADLVITWTNPTSANLRDVEVRIWNSSGKTVLYHTGYNAGGRYTWTLAQQRIDTSGTLDPSVFFELRSRTWSGTLGTAPAGSTVTNATPSAPSAVSFIQSPGSITITVTATPPADFAAYRYRLIQTLPSSADVTWDSPSALGSYSIYAQATYQVGVKVLDVFGQLSSETLSSATIVDSLTISALRADVVYSDNDGNPDSTLHIPLSNAVLTSGGVTYATTSTWNKWIRAERPLLERYRTITLSMTAASGTSSWYVRLSQDATTWVYFAGPIVGTKTLTSVANAAAAQATPISAASLGGQTTSKIELPSTVEARFVEVWIRNPAPANTRVDEFYPRRAVEADDIYVQNLSGISADLGTITAGTITGATIQTAASGARVKLDSTGLTTYDSGGVVQVTATTATDGALTAGGGQVTLDAAGLQLLAATSSTPANSVSWLKSSVVVGSITTQYGSGFHNVRIRGEGDATNTGTVILTGDGENGGTDATLTVRGDDTGTPSYIELLADTLSLYGDLLGGAYTPTYQGATTGGTTTYAVQVGFYTVIGNRVDFWAHVRWTAATGTGAVQISLPLTAANVSDRRGAVTVNTTSVTFTGSGVQGLILPNTNYVLLSSPLSNAIRADITVEPAGEIELAGHFYT